MENNSLPHENNQTGRDGSGPSDRKQPHQIIKSGLLMLTSAFLGGVAFALWNRRQIASMKEKSEDIPSDAVPSAEDDAIY